jgi:hypothetical protein
MLKYMMPAAAISLMALSSAWAMPAAPVMKNTGIESNLIEVQHRKGDVHRSAKPHRSMHHPRASGHRHSYRGRHYSHRYSARPHDWNTRGCFRKHRWTLFHPNTQPHSEYGTLAARNGRETRHDFKRSHRL